MGRFVNRSDLLKFIKGWRASVTASLEEARSYVDHAAPWGTAWNGDRNVSRGSSLLSWVTGIERTRSAIFLELIELH